MSGDLGRLVLQFAADVAGFQSDLGRVERAANKSAKETAKAFDNAVNSITTSVKTAAIQIGAALAAAFTVGALKDFIKAGIDVADKINEVAQKTGIGTEALSALKFAAEQSGVEFESLTSSLIRVEVNAAKAANGNEKLKGAFAALGVEVTDANGKVKAGNVLFTELSAAFSKLENGPQKNAIGIELFGKSFAKLVPLLNEGPEGLRKFTDEAERLGLIVDPITAKLADDFNDALTGIKQAAEGAGISLASDLLPSLIDAAEKITDFIVAAKDSGELEKFGQLLASLIDAMVKITAAVVDAREEFVVLLEVFGNVTGITRMIELLKNLGAALDRVRGSSKGVDPGDNQQKASKGGLQISEVVTKNTRDYAAAVALVGRNSNAAAPQAREFVEAVRVLSIKKEIVGTPKELASAIRAIREELNPTLKIMREYDEKVIELTKSTAADVNQTDRNRIALEKLKLQRDKDIAAVKTQVTSYETVRASLAREIEALKGGTLAREELAKALRIEEEFKKQIALATSNGTKLTTTETEAIHKQVEELDKLKNYKPFDLGTAISDSISDGMRKASVSEGFKAFFKKIKEAFSGSSSQIAFNALNLASDSAQFLGGIIDNARADNAGGGNAVGSAARSINGALAASNIPYVSQIAAIIAAVDKIAGGRIFGTSNKQTASGQSATFSQSGFTGSTTAFYERQRALFGGIARSQTVTPADQAAASQMTEFFDSIRNSVALGARTLGVTLPPLIAGAFSEIKDKDGKITKQISEVAGRIFTEGFADFQKRIQAENIIAVVGQSASDAGAIAEQWRANAELLSQGAKFFLVSQADFVNGVKILGDSQNLGGLTKIVQELADPGEALVETYARIRNGTLFLRAALADIGVTTEKTAEQFLRFSTDLITALGGLQNASQLINRNINEFFKPEELRATRLTGARNTLADLGKKSGLGILSDADFKDLLKQALAGAFSPERTAEILAYGDALLTVNGLVRETTSATEASTRAELDRIAALALATKSLNDFVSGLQDTAADGSLTNYQRTLKALNKQYESNAQNLTDLARQAGLTAAPIEGVTANLSILAQGAARALGDLKITVLRGLQAAFGNPPELTPYERFNNLIYGNAVATNNWADQLKELEDLQAAQDLARNIADLFKASGLSFADGVAQYGIPLRGLLDQLGVDFANLTSPASIAAFGAAAGLLGLSARDLAELAGIDLSGLTQAQLDALDLASKPQFQAAEASAKSLVSIDEKSTSIITVLMEQRTEARNQSQALIRLGANFSSLADEVRRIANRVPA